MGQMRSDDTNQKCGASETDVQKRSGQRPARSDPAFGSTPTAQIGLNLEEATAVENLLECGVDEVGIGSAIAEVYAAGEDPIPGASRDDLVAGLIAHGHRHARALQDESELARLVKEQARPGDMVVCLGAGTISSWANALPAKLMGAAA